MCWSELCSYGGKLLVVKMVRYIRRYGVYANEKRSDATDFLLQYRQKLAIKCGKDGFKNKI